MVFVVVRVQFLFSFIEDGLIIASNGIARERYAKLVDIIAGTLNRTFRVQDISG